MKISFIFDKCNLGGTESAIKNRMDHLIDMGVDCDIIFIYPGQEAETFKNHKHYVAESYLKIYNIVKSSDVIDILSPLGFILKKMYKMERPIIHEDHCPGYFSYLPFLDRNRVKAVLFPSKFQMEEGKKSVPRGIPSYFLYNCLGKDFLRGEADINSSSKKIILWVGRIEERKNWRFLIELSKHLPYEYVIRVVTNSSRSPEYGEFIKIRAAQGLENKIEVVSDCPYSKILSHYLEASKNGCHLTSTYSESFGMTLIEAQFANCPMVLTDLAVFREVAGNSAEYYPINNVNECIRKIQRVCTQGSYRERIIQDGRDRYRMLFEPVHICRNFIDIAKSVSV